MAKIWQAREAAVKIDLASNVTITDSAALSTFFSGATALEGHLTEITITPPEQDWDKIDLLGEDANSFQNADKDKKPVGVAELSGKLVLRGDETIEDFAYSDSTAISTTHTRYQAGALQDISILVDNDDGTDEQAVVLDNANITKIGDLSLNADGHWERDITIKCLAKDFYEEFKD